MQLNQICAFHLQIFKKKTNNDSFKWVFTISEIYDKKTQSKLLKLAKDLNMTEWELLIHLETLPDVG